MLVFEVVLYIIADFAIADVSISFILTQLSVLISNVVFLWHYRRWFRDRDETRIGSETLRTEEKYEAGEGRVIVIKRGEGGGRGGMLGRAGIQRVGSGGGRGGVVASGSASGLSRAQMAAAKSTSVAELTATHSRSNGNITSVIYNGIEIQTPDMSKPSAINSGFGSSQVTAETIGTDYIKLTVQNSTSAPNLIHYYVAKKGDNMIYMATYVTAAYVELRMLMRLATPVVPTGPLWDEQSPMLTKIPSGSGYLEPVSDVRNGTVVEGQDVFLVGNETRSKFYSSERFIDDLVPALVHGTYTVKMYRNEFPVYTGSVAITAGQTIAQNITSSEANRTNLFQIGNIDGQPFELKNGNKFLRMHPSDARMGNFTANYVVGANNATDFPMALFKYITPPTISFDLAAIPPNATLYISTTAAFQGGRPLVKINTNTFTAPPAPTNLNSRSVTRGAYRGLGEQYNWNLQPYLIAGTNVLTIDVASRGAYGDAGVAPSSWCMQALSTSCHYNSDRHVYNHFWRQRPNVDSRFNIRCRNYFHHHNQCSDIDSFHHIRERPNFKFSDPHYICHPYQYWQRRKQNTLVMAPVATCRHRAHSSPVRRRSKF
ncbi:hypothetical protein HDV00_004424 [Rhizophlyctis rosea]|nr:hypothetical protein HDV00_004424 [Rhizophlyctis rosea]